MGKCRLWVNVAWVNVAMGMCRMGICRLTQPCSNGPKKTCQILAALRHLGKDVVDRAYVSGPVTIRPI